MNRLAPGAVALLLALAAVPASPADAARFRTKNFDIDAPTEAMAQKIGEAAEIYREELALEWTGMTMPPWPKPCPVKVKVGDIGAGGQTTFTFDRGQVFGWRMEVQGSMERILDSVLPHEISHTVFACYFRRPLPRWADEGAATLVEHESERGRQTRLLNQVIRTSKRIPLKSLLSMTEYPTEMRDVLTLYAEGYALADLLVQKEGRATYLKVLQTAHERGWSHALKKHYGYSSVDELEKEWTGWVLAGSPTLEDDTMLAQADGPSGARSQSPQERPAVASSRESVNGSGRGANPSFPDPFKSTITASNAGATSAPFADALDSQPRVVAVPPKRDRSNLTKAVHIRQLERSSATTNGASMLETAAGQPRRDVFRVPGFAGR